MKVAITLGQLIDDLKRCEPSAHVWFDFCNLVPTRLDSYRGYYDQLALGFDGTQDAPPITVEWLLSHCEEAVGKTYQGYKGGDYVMTRSTPVWVANYGYSGDTAIVKVEQVYDTIIRLKTRTVD